MNRPIVGLLGVALTVGAVIAVPSLSGDDGPAEPPLPTVTASPTPQEAALAVDDSPQSLATRNPFAGGADLSVAEPDDTDAIVVVDDDDAPSDLESPATSAPDETATSTPDPVETVTPPPPAPDGSGVDLPSLDEIETTGR